MSLRATPPSLPPSEEDITAGQDNPAWTSELKGALSPPPHDRDHAQELRPIIEKPAKEWEEPAEEVSG